MNKREFWRELDKLVLGFDEDSSQLPAKRMAIVKLFQQAYDEDLPIIVACEFDPVLEGAAHNLFVPTDIGRMYLFFSSKEAARKLSDADHYAEAKLRNIMNNIFNRPEAMAIAFNGREEGCVILRPFIESGFEGINMELPPDFREAKPGGWSLCDSL